MSDPRMEERLKVERIQRTGYLPTQVMERIELKLSPVDDNLPFDEAVGQKKEADKAARHFGKRQRGRA